MSLDIHGLEDAIHHLHGCHSHHRETVWVTERTDRGRVLFEGGVHVFSLRGHPTADSAYVWTDEVENGAEKLFVVLRGDGVSSAKDAVSAAIALQRTTLN